MDEIAGLIVNEGRKRGSNAGRTDELLQFAAKLGIRRPRASGSNNPDRPVPPSWPQPSGPSALIAGIGVEARPMK
jgi:hypothetical protein